MALSACDLSAYVLIMEIQYTKQVPTCGHPLPFHTPQGKGNLMSRLQIQHRNNKWPVSYWSCWRPSDTLKIQSKRICKITTRTPDDFFHSKMFSLPIVSQRHKIIPWQLFKNKRQYNSVQAINPITCSSFIVYYRFRA